jgi:hypothetical protein
MSEWPRSSAAVQADWLDAVLRKNGMLTDSKVTNVTAADVGTGVGIMGEVARFSIEYDKPGNGAPATVVGKFPTADPTNLDVARALFFYPREVAFYTKLAQDSPIRTPRLLHAELDMRDHSFVLLLEDLYDVTHGDQITGLTPAQAEAAVTALGRLHGAWWGRVDVAGMETLFDFANPDYGAALQAGYQGFLEPALDNGSDCFSPYTKKVARGLAPVAARAVEQVSSSWRTLLHGDFRADNLMFGAALGQDGVAAVDWQISGKGGALYDVAYLICNSMPIAYHQKAEKDLLHRYHDTLLQSGVQGFTFEDCWSAYRFAVLCGLFVAIYTTGGMDVGNERGLNAMRAIARRVDAAVSQLEVGELLPQ